MRKKLRAAGRWILAMGPPPKYSMPPSDTEARLARLTDEINRHLKEYRIVRKR